MIVPIYKSADGIYGMVYYKSAMTMRFAGKSTEDSEIFLQSQWIQNLKRDGRRFDKAQLLFDAAVTYFKPDIIATIPSHAPGVENTATRLANKYNRNPITRVEKSAKAKYNETGRRNGTAAEAFNAQKLTWDWESMRGKHIMLFDDLSKSGTTMRDFKAHILSVLPDARITCVVLALGWKMVQHVRPQESFAKGDIDSYMDISNRVVFDSVEVPGMSFELAGLKAAREDGGKADKFDETRQGFLTRMAEISAFRVDGKIVDRNVAIYVAYIEFIKEHQYVPNSRELALYSGIGKLHCSNFLANASTVTMRSAFEKLRPMIDSMALSMADMALRGSVKATELIAKALNGSLDAEGGTSDSEPLEIIIKGGKRATPYERGEVQLPSHIFVRRTSDSIYDIAEIDIRGDVVKSTVLDGTYTTRAEAWESLKRAYADFGFIVDEDRRTIYRGGDL